MHLALKISITTKFSQKSRYYQRPEPDDWNCQQHRLRCLLRAEWIAELPITTSIPSKFLDKGTITVEDLNTMVVGVGDINAIVMAEETERGLWTLPSLCPEVAISKSTIFINFENPMPFHISN